MAGRKFKDLRRDFSCFSTKFGIESWQYRQMCETPLTFIDIPGGPHVITKVLSLGLSTKSKRTYITQYRAKYAQIQGNLRDNSLSITTKINTFQRMITKSRISYYNISSSIQLNITRNENKGKIWSGIKRKDQSMKNSNTNWTGIKTNIK